MSFLSARPLYSLLGAPLCPPPATLHVAEFFHPSGPHFLQGVPQLLRLKSVPLILAPGMLCTTPSQHTSLRIVTPGSLSRTPGTVTSTKGKS